MPHNQPTPNHVVHALVSLFLVGLWIPIWILIAASAGKDPAVCVKCGNRRLPNGPATIAGQAGGVAVGAPDIAPKTKLIIFGAAAVLLVAGIAYGMYLDG